MLVNVKSTPLVEDNVVQLIASSPVNVNEIEVEFEDAEVAARVKVGGVVSTTTGVYRTITTPSPPSDTLLPVVDAPAPPPVLSTPLLPVLVDDPFPPPCWPRPGVEPPPPPPPP